MREALATPEFLEAILLQVDRRSLLTSVQRVCTVWHKAIATFPSLQQYFFFRALSSKTGFVPNPLLIETFLCFYPDPDRMHNAAWQEHLRLIPKTPSSYFVSAGHELKEEDQRRRISNSNSCTINNHGAWANIVWRVPAEMVTRPQSSGGPFSIRTLIQKSWLDRAQLPERKGR